MYARRLRITVLEDEEAFYFAPNEGALDHGRRDWVAKSRAIEERWDHFGVVRFGLGSCWLFFIVVVRLLI